MKLFKRKRKYKYINGTRGVISLFLCLLMMPMLTIASALIELSRYQQTESVFQEVMDTATLSTIANYDKYVQQRFGLFAISQNCKISETYKNSLKKNSAVMEGISLGSNIDAEGSLPLSDTDVLKRQILDFSESTVLTEIILENLHLQELLDELGKLMDIEKVISTISAMHNMTTKVKDLVRKGEEFVEKIEAISTQVETVQSNAEKFARSISDLYKKICDNGHQIDSSTAETEEASIKTIIEKYLSDIETIYNDASTLITSVTSLKDMVVTIPTDLQNVTTAYKEAADAVKTVTQSFSNVSKDIDTDSKGKGEGNVGENSEQATSLFDAVINSVGKALDSAATQLGEDVIASLKEAADQFAGQLKEDLGLDVTKRWNLKEYYSIPLSDDAKNDIKDILKDIPAVWEEGSYDAVVKTLINKYIPKVFNMRASVIVTTLKSAIKDAKETFVNCAKDSFGRILTDLVNTLKGLFDLDLFYDGSLNAYLDEATINTLVTGKGDENDNPYIDFLRAITELISAVDKLVNLKVWEFYKLIDVVTDLFNSVKSTINGIKNTVKSTADKISEVVEWVSEGKWEKFGELLLMSGYMIHNLPNRTDVAKGTFTINSSVEYKTNLNGQTLTGFQYSEILTPSKVFSSGIGTGDTEENEGEESSISALIDFFNDSANGGGTDKMFRGAELEYIMAGTPSELMNQTFAFMNIYMLRFLLDLVPVFTDPAVTAMAGSATIACWAVYLIVAFAEPFCDTVLLVNGSKNVSFIKRSCYLTPTGADNLIRDLSAVITDNSSVKDAFIGSLEGKFGEKKYDFEPGFFKTDYSTHCLLILMFTTTTGDMLKRLADIIQLETNYYYSKQSEPQTFDIYKAYTGISASADVEFDSFIKIFQTNNSSSLIKKTFTRTQTY